MSDEAMSDDVVAGRAENVTVYLAGLVQGIALVTFPAISTILTAAGSYHLSSSQYGMMFLPQVVLAITAALLGAGMARRFNVKRVYLAGLAANLGSMVLLLASRFVPPEQAAAYGLLLAATACLGAGFGLTTPALNILAAAFHPGAIDRAVLTLNALLGLGTALAPVFVAVFVGLGFWEGLPLLVVILLVALFEVSLRLPLRVPAHVQPAPVPAASAQAAPRRARPAIPAQFWVFAGFAVLYGFCETMNGNWSQLYLTGGLGSSTVLASLALTVFWSMVTAGRVLIAAVQRWLPSRLAYHALPILLAVAFGVISVSPRDVPVLGILAFALAGLGCSALLPLTISFGQERLPVMAGAMAGGVIACYQLGYGIAAFGVGPLLDTGVTLRTVFAAGAGVAALMAVTSFAVAGRHCSPLSLHPRPVPVGAGH